jgi:hypothetical protein
MTKHLIVGAAALLAIAVLMPNAANAGASASAPSKYAGQTHNSQLRADRQNVPISEYSSSTRRASQKH